MPRFYNAIEEESTLAQTPVMRLYRIRTKPAYRQTYQQSIRENIVTSIENEPDILAMYATHARDHVNTNFVFEAYRDEVTLHKHAESVHFKKYITTAMQSLTDRTVFELVPQLIIEKNQAIAEEYNKDLIVRLAKVEVDSKLNEAYRSVTLDTLIASMDTEENMLACYVGRLQSNDRHWRIIEIFTDHESFEAHRESDNFVRYLEETEAMIIHREQYDLRADTLFNRGGQKFIYKQ